MSTIWTPSGERPVGRDRPDAGAPPAPEPAGAGTPKGPQGDPSGRGSGRPSAPDELTDEELAEQMRAVQEQLAQTPAAVVIANHCIGLFQLAALHLDQDPPNLEEAQLAIDAMAGVVEGLGSRLGEAEPTLRDALSQLRLGYVQVKAAAGQ